jgi:DNA processing protein
VHQENSRKASYYHALNLIPSLGPIRIKKLIEYFSTPDRVWKASITELSGVEGFNRVLVEKIARERDRIDLEKSWKKVKELGQSMITWEDDNYPLFLREIYDPPPLIYFMGDINVVKSFCLAIVGSRRNTLYGKEIAYKFASILSDYGVTIVSGMARGIDTWAHKGVIDVGGKTAAVLGCSLEICYPPENKTIREKIIDNGLLISEFPPGSSPLPQNFPRRNRIISGLSQGIIVVEAGEKSGALITAEFALEHGREVFAIPGSISSPYSKGCHKLIKEGAKLVENVEDILEELQFSFEIEGFPSSDNKGQKKIVNNNSDVQLNFSADEFNLLEVVPYEALTLEEIAIHSNMPLSKVNALLLELELKGVIKQLPGKYFIRN